MNTVFAVLNAIPTYQNKINTEDKVKKELQRLKTIQLYSELKRLKNTKNKTFADYFQTVSNNKVVIFNFKRDKSMRR